MDSRFAESRFTPAAQLALERFPVDAESVVLVNISENVTFRVTVRGSDTDYVLRLHRPDYNSIEELESERTWAAALRRAGVPVQDSLLSCEGKHFELIDIPGTSEQRFVGMSTWLDGMPLSDYLEANSGREEQERLFRRVGEIAAAMHNQSTCWKEPEGFTRRRLDLDGLLGEAPVWGRFWDHAGLTAAERKLLLQAREECCAALSAYGERPDNFSVIHSDMHPDNIVYNGRDLAPIDFDDTAYGWHMYDIASALVEGMFVPNYADAHAAFLDGYRDHRPLAQHDEEMLPVFLLIRGMAIIGWFHERPEHLGSAYFEDVKNWVIGECRGRLGSIRSN